VQPTHWQDELRSLITNPHELFALLELDAHALPEALQASQHFPMRVPRSFARRMQKKNPNDPLLLQVLPTGNELVTAEGYTADPVGDAQANIIPGLLHKYAGRVLLIVSGGCAVNCRYCFRRDFPYESNNPGRLEWERALTYIANDSSISEVILSGGDPLVVSNKQLGWLMGRVSAIPHIKRLRIHTRLPIVIPSRIDDELIDILSTARPPVAVVVHCNHAQELDDEVTDCFLKLKNIRRLSLLNQSVLLKGINDSADALIALSQALFAAGVLPYYLHLLDKAKGTAHFDVPDEQADHLMRVLLRSLPGYLVPRLVREEAGQPHKTPFILKT
jgi:EF-P beta-lysylation protein EpmB